MMARNESFLHLVSRICVFCVWMWVQSVQGKHGRCGRNNLPGEATECVLMTTDEWSAGMREERTAEGTSNYLLSARKRIIVFIARINAPDEETRNVLLIPDYRLYTHWLPVLPLLLHFPPLLSHAHFS